MSTRLKYSVQVKRRLQCDTSAMTFTSAILLKDEDVRKNSKVGKRNDFSYFSGNQMNLAPSLVSENKEVTKNGKVLQMVATKSFRKFRRICGIQRRPSG